MKFFASICFSLIAFANPVIGQTISPVAEEQAYIVKIFEKIQPRSFALNREICGYIGRNDAGRLVSSRLSTGSEAGCTLPHWPTKFDVIASFHTHSTYSPEYNSEVPSSTDMESDEASGIDGWIATPGGRLWYVDSSEMIAYQICGHHCVPQDPNYIDEPGQNIKPYYSYRAILKGEGY
ncbi:hypothetical protein BVC71_01535 [Marivivens niveibacter]|uniref:DUF4329 domain-containing protein n=1 Tax=Marivivens niveibacter TaxID=1930667 RepID=A0A251X0S0_9RHOB|nr:DUF4329 domain-containing protein [Marivivens niveibacter]OUD10222.1 hypothetical protein BVC71_01535 [Marivivens niveibacter]